MTRRRRPRGISRMVYSLLHTVIYPGSRRNRVHVYACACVRVRAIPAQVHVLLTISNCTEGRPRKTFPSVLPPYYSLPPRIPRKGGGTGREEIARIRRFFFFEQYARLDEGFEEGVITRRDRGGG